MHVCIRTGKRKKCGGNLGLVMFSLSFILCEENLNILHFVTCTNPVARVMEVLALIPLTGTDSKVRDILHRPQLKGSCIVLTRNRFQEPL